MGSYAICSLRTPETICMIGLESGFFNCPKWMICTHQSELDAGHLLFVAICEHLERERGFSPFSTVPGHLAVICG